MAKLNQARLQPKPLASLVKTRRASSCSRCEEPIGVGVPAIRTQFRTTICMQCVDEWLAVYVTAVSGDGQLGVSRD